MAKSPTQSPVLLPNGGWGWTNGWRSPLGSRPDATNCSPDDTMPLSHYSVIQYVPDLTAGERVNVGLMVFAEEGPPVVKVVKSWDRVQRFSGMDVSAVKEFVTKLEAGEGAVASLSDARRLSESWHYSVQVTTPQ